MSLKNQSFMCKILSHCFIFFRFSTHHTSCARTEDDFRISFGYFFVLIYINHNSANSCILVSNLWPSCQTMVTNQLLDALHLWSTSEDADINLTSNPFLFGIWWQEKHALVMKVLFEHFLIHKDISPVNNNEVLLPSGNSTKENPNILARLMCKANHNSAFYCLFRTVTRKFSIWEN